MQKKERKKILREFLEDELARKEKAKRDQDIVELVIVGLLAAFTLVSFGLLILLV